MQQELPFIYAHEHTTVDLSGVKKDLDCRLDETEKTIREFNGLHERGVGMIVDVTNRGMGRDVNTVCRVAQQTGVTILHSTGYYKEPFLPAEVYDHTEEQLAQMMVEELTTGIEDTGVKASVIGEIGTSKERIEPAEEKIFRASCRAQLQTGVPIVTHTTLGLLGLEQVALFQQMGVDLSRVVLSHIDLSGDVEYMKRLLDKGVNIAFDTVGKNNYQPDEQRAKWLVALCEAGYAGQIVMSMDITRKSHFKENGGLGYAYLLDTFVPMLRRAGIRDAALHQLLCETPARIYKAKEATV